MIGIVQRFALQSHACMRSTIVAIDPIDPIDPILIQPRIQEIQIVPLPYTSNEQKKHRTSCINKKRHQTGCVSKRAATRRAATTEKGTSEATYDTIISLHTHYQGITI
eukprot:63677_1